MSEKYRRKRWRIQQSSLYSLFECISKQWQINWRMSTRCAHEFVRSIQILQYTALLECRRLTEIVCEPKHSTLLTECFERVRQDTFAHTHTHSNRLYYYTHATQPSEKANMKRGENKVEGKENETTSCVSLCYIYMIGIAVLQLLPCILKAMAREFMCLLSHATSCKVEEPTVRVQ